MGQCQYRYNPTEQYQRTKHGMAPETICGAKTYPAIDEPEIQPYPRGDGTTEFRHTGKLLPRPHHDPYCPAHGGSPEPPPQPVTLPELESAYQRYLELSSRFEGAIPASVSSPHQVVIGQPLQVTSGKADDEQQ